jgi:ABC-type branched-subunit amino acid transport system ATPase component
MILQLTNITGGYHKNTEILNGINLEIQKGEVLAIVGQNGAGKSTLAKAICNLLPHRTGEIIFNKKNISRLNTIQLNQLGIVYFMQGGRVFPELTVKENMLFATLNSQNTQLNYSMFPELQKHWLKQAGLLSGGERHQLALAMALVKKPNLLILDEPSAGLSPIATAKLYKILGQIKNSNPITILLIEQNIGNAINFSSRVAVIQQGAIATILSTNNKQQTINTIQKLYF